MGGVTIYLGEVVLGIVSPDEVVLGIVCLDERDDLFPKSPLSPSPPSPQIHLLSHCL